jgi:hypothetical protein
MVCNPGGGISSKLTIDSDWKARGGKENFNDRQRIEDEWEVTIQRSKYKNNIYKQWKHISSLPSGSLGLA